MSDTSPRDQEALRWDAKANGAAPAAKSREVLCRFLRGHDRFTCELLDHGSYGIEAQFFQNEEFWYSRRFDPALDRSRTSRDLAVAWAEEERKFIEKGDA